MYSLLIGLAVFVPCFLYQNIFICYSPLNDKKRGVLTLAAWDTAAVNIYFNSIKLQVAFSPEGIILPAATGE